MLACPECRKLYPSDASECPDDGRTLVDPELLPGDRDEALAPGTKVGEYRIDRRLGAGSFGAVYAAKQPLIGKRVAIKVLHRRFTAETGVVSRFVSEARLVNRIRHRNIIDIFSFGLLDDKQPYFVMELLEGLTLGELLHREKRLGVAEALSILEGIAAGLDAAHEAGVAHRDLKPDNIFLATEKGGGYFPKLLDFGVAKLVADDLAHKTATGAAIGTPSYMAPEQCRGKRVDHRADVYALGVVIHEMLTGRRLFQADSAMDVLLMHVSDPPPPMSRVCPDLPPELDAPVLAMLAKKPEQRPSSAGAAVAALAERARGSGADRTLVTAAPITPGARAALGSGPEPPRLSPTPGALEAATVTSAGARAVAAAKTPSEEAPALRGAEAFLTGEGPGAPLATSEPAPASPRDSTGPGDQAEAPAAGGAPRLVAPATTSDGRFALSSKGNTIKVWDLRTGQAVHTFPGQGGLPEEAAPRPKRDAVSAPRAPSQRPPPALRPPRSRGRPMLVAGAAIVAGMAILAALALLQKSRAPAPPPVTAEPVRHEAERPR